MKRNCFSKQSKLILVSVNFKYIYKIIDKNEWKKAKDSGTYLGSSKDLEDGYIHFSGEDQVKGTLEKYFS